MMGTTRTLQTYIQMPEGFEGSVSTFGRFKCPTCQKFTLHEIIDGYKACVWDGEWTTEDREKQDIEIERFIG